MKLILDEEAVLSAIRAHVVDVLGLANVEIQHIRGIVPRKQDAMLTIEVEVSRIVSQEPVSTVPVQQVVATPEVTATTAAEPETLDEEPEGDESKQLSIFDQEEVDEPQAEPEPVVVTPTTSTGPLL